MSSSCSPWERNMSAARRGCQGKRTGLERSIAVNRFGCQMLGCPMSHVRCICQSTHCPKNQMNIWWLGRLTSTSYMGHWTPQHLTSALHLVCLAEQHSADLFCLLGSEEKISTETLFDRLQVEAGLHDSTNRVGVVRQH
jgi:hypothetical protein